MTDVFTPVYAANLGLMIVEFADAYSGNPNEVRPVLPQGSILANNWIIDGYLVANDGLFPVGESSVLTAVTVCYGVLAHLVATPNQYVVLLRGTAGTREWLIDAEFFQVAHPIPGSGNVERGFHDIYATMEFLPANGTGNEGLIAWKAITSIVGQGDLVVAGHSLGSTLATYLTYDLVKLGNMANCVRGCYFASPRPGNADFAQAFDSAVSQYVVYDYAPDEIPDTPPELSGYQSLPKVMEITPENSKAVISNNLGANHHMLCYCAMLDYNAVLDWKTLLIADQDDPQSIVGPNVQEASQPSAVQDSLSFA